jgi:hypothetical protein
VDEVQQSINERLSKPTEDAQQDEAQKESPPVREPVSRGGSRDTEQKKVIIE